MTLLRVRGLGRRYGGLHALRDVSLDLAAGSRHAVIGANGAGKSTLFNLIAGTVRPSGGTIAFDGHDITRLGAAARARRGIGRTFQHPAVFERLSATANVALALRRRARPRPTRITAPWGRAVRAEARALLRDAGLGEHADIPVGSLPYGVRRRLEMTLALATKPRLLLLDEPSAGLDPDDIARLVATIRELPSAVTVLLIDHHLDLVWDVADTVTVLHHGQHVATGTPAEIRADPEVQAAYLTTSEVPARTSDRRAVAAEPVLRVRGLTVGYQGAPVIPNLDLDLIDGAVTALLGRNGAGKTTLLNAVAGLIPAAPGGRVTLGGAELPRRPQRIAHAGLAIVPQGRRLFDLTVGEHLTLASATGRGGTGGGHMWSRDEALALLPALRDRLRHHAAQLSGGEQQMLALARALLGNPRVLLLDEPSEGLAPAVIQQISAALARVAANGVTVLIAEQNLSFAMRVADRVVVLDRGRIVLDSPAVGFDESVRRRLDDLLGVTVTSV